ERYSDVVQIYKNGFSAKLKASWDLKSVYIEDFINDSGSDWNFDTHQKIDTKPNLCDFKKTIADYLSWEVSNILKDRGKYWGKPQALVCLEETFKANGGDWREYRIGELFEIALSKGDNQPKKLLAGDIPLISAGENNNGVVAYIKEGDGISQIFQGNTITADMFGNVFYQPRDYYAVSHGRVNILIPNNVIKNSFNEKTSLFFVAQLSKIKNLYSYSYMLTSKRIGNEKITLPTINNQIAFDYIEAYIQELEQERIQELEAYLQASGLKDTTLTQNEQTALHTFLDTDYNSGGGGTIVA
ncbi:MAG: restriction endonuclease subunit S, partial [Acetobacter sp.]|nr:restriction endonuclease subunit S [Acetobacter sp.]